VNDDDERRADDYRQARIGAASALVVALLLILLIDALSADYEASPIVVGAILGTIATLVGVEIRAQRP
jgi:hypothetical protein